MIKNVTSCKTKGKEKGTVPNGGRRGTVPNGGVMVGEVGDIGKIAQDLAFTDDIEEKRKIFSQILKAASRKGIRPSSIHRFYEAMGRSEFGGFTPLDSKHLTGFTVPAINLRTMTYDLARAVFRVAKRMDAGAFIFEIARSEIGYTDQSPAEYAGLCLAAAIEEGYTGPVFIQGDHFQISAKKFKEGPDKEVEAIKSLIAKAIEAGFYNIDIDSSTLVDLSRSTTKDQQQLNYEISAKLTQFIRGIQPEGLEISVGGEIGEVGGKNSTPEELRAFMEGYRGVLGEANVGISKISVQTGTTHGGVVLPDGTIARVKLDFDTLKVLSRLAREEFGLAGCVQHGASTLPAEAFGKFPEVGCAEIHLATEFQNIIYESELFPAELRDRAYAWIKENLAGEQKEGQTEEQFIYKTRKKAFGPFKKEILGLSSSVREAIAQEVEKKFEFLFEKLNVANTMELVSRYIPK